ncbi:SpaA isopeptide-forming pilin-related protein [Clostridium sp. C8-1-8]|uniref:SpaA isopeptide-forming pilin-related protein n=1 Tax=Clostridium sp. C8-1-8 TaxID=2698831 RepID=UPI0013690EB0|nr:SpaA isopeptide-forming pilin-related protein [Clostridium sp. C8-1-8]
MNKKRFLSFVVVIIFILQMIVPVNNVKAATRDITGAFPLITDVKITDINGKELGSNISKNSEIHINYTWSIPNDQTVNAGDYYTMQLPNEIKIATAIDQPMINPKDGSVVANIHVDTNGKTKITFTSYPSGHSDVLGGFSLDCHFNQSQIGNANPVKIDFTVPGLGVVTEGPFNFQQPDPTIVKSGVYNSTNDEVTWTITVNKEGVKLSNTVVTDNINSGQVFVDGSVNINGTAAVSGTGYSYDNTSRKLTINMGEITTQQVITFKTSIHNDLAAKAQGTYNYTNAATLNYDSSGNPKSLTSNTVTIPVTVKYISKDGSYETANKRISWTIKVNQSGRTINNAVVTDAIPAGLTIDTSTIKVDGAPGTDYTISGQNFRYNLKNISSVHTITFSTNVDSAVYNSNNYKSYNNTAFLSGDGVLNGTYSSRAVGFTPNIIQKQGAGYNPSTGIITWRIIVNNNQTAVAAGAKVTDNIPIGQVYVAGSGKLDGTALDDSGYTAATSSDTTKTGTFTYTFSSAFSDTHTITFQTKVTDPKVYKASYSGNFNNSVTLTSADINQTTSATQPVNSEIINKTGAGYNYATREITWNIRINKNKMPITNAVITDYIPAGQVYVSGSATIDNSASADGFKYTQVDGDSQKTGVLTYTFPTGSSNTINNTYNISFKTKIIDLSIFNTNGVKTLSNTASIAGDEIPTDGNRSSTGSQTVNNTVINKTPSYVYGNSYIDWTLNVNSNFNIYMSNATITDKLQNGLSLNTDTVELYEATVNANGTLTAGAKVPLTGANVKYDPTTREFGFTFPDNAAYKPYILKFTTDVSAAGNYSNTVEFKSTDTDQTSSTNQNGVWYASGSAWGTGVSGSINVVKVDANDTSKKLSGAVFQLIDQYGNVKATSAPTGPDGTALFKALKYDVNYTLKEITPPTGYTLNDEAHTFQVHDATGQRDIAYSFKDTKIKGNIQFTKNGEDGKGLLGAEFALYQNDGVTPILDSDGKGITAVSDKDGKVQFTNIDYGTYKIKETKSPNGYTLSTDILTATFSGDYQNTVVTVNPNSISNIRIRGGIKITKVDAATSSPVPGATITVYNSDGTPVGTGTEGITATDGTVEFDNLVYGDYYFLETKAPEGYLLNTDKHPFSIKDNGVVLKDTLSDTRIIGGIKITKTDEATSKPVPGATIALYTSDGKAVGSGVEGVTGADGTVEFDNLSYGDYYFMETKAPEGYLLNEDKHPFSIKNNGVIIKDTISDTRITGGIKITKSDVSTSIPLPGATITVYTSDGKVVGSGVEGVTGLDGTVEFDNLAYGDYYFLETKAPEGYLLNTDKHPFTIKENGVILKDTISDTRIKGGIKITKTDISTSAPVPGATITVYTSDGKAVGSGLEGVTGLDGTVQFDNLSYGDYYFVETNAPRGYLLNTDKHSFSIKENGVIITSSFSDEKVKGTVLVEKKGEDGNYLSDTEVTLYDANGKVVQSSVTDSDGISRFTGVEYGKYAVRETRAPKGYNISDKLISVEVNGTESGKTYDAGDITDTKIRGSIQIKKLDQDGKPLKGAEFTVYDESGKAIQTAVSMEDGIVLFKDLVYGKYSIKETKVPEGYIGLKDIIEASIEQNGYTYSYEVKNNRIKGTVEIKKTDISGNALQGAEFTIYDNSGNAIAAKVSDSNGLVRFETLDYGKYTVKETKAPQGYNISDKVVSVNVDGTGKGGTYDAGAIADTKVTGNVQIKKLSEDGKTLKDAEFTLYDLSGKAVKSIVTEENGTAIFTDVEYGKYTLKETKAPQGYNISAEETVVEVNGTESGKVYDAGTITDTKIKGSIKINKLDQAGRPLQGAVFTLYDESGKALQTAVSMEDGVVLFKDLDYGKYSVKETKVPEGYIASSDDIETSVESNGYTYSYEVKNARIKATIEVKKTDISGKVLQGAEFTLYDSNGKAISTQVTGSNGIARFEAVDYGTYTIKETKAPKGYIINTSVQKVQVSTSNTQSFIIKDEQEVQVLPTTGAVIDDTFITIMALLLIVLGIGLKLFGKVTISKRY